ncbi:MAG: hypothetical protein CL610_24490 [Anaerolineaceae bacterium]|nr:hypothetical protein [Anaerolineaceae bacterium]
MLPEFVPDETPLERMSRIFTRFAAHETVRIAPMYGHLSEVVAADPELLELATHAPREPVPNVLFAAVQYLLMKGVAHPLAAYYASIAGDTVRTDDPAPAFQAFCRQYRDEIIHLMQTRLVQTNEVNRCVLLLPAFGLVAQREQGRPLALIEVGCSAALNLLWDYYAYDYGDGRVVGPADAPLRLNTVPRGDHHPPVPDTLPAVGFRLGLDLNPINLLDDDQALWLRALVWPEHRERAQRLEQTIAIARQHPPATRKGDALHLLPDAMAQAPDDMVLCVLHSFVTNQFSDAQRDQFTSLLRAHTEPIYRISIEWLNEAHPRLELRVYQGGEEVEKRLLAYVESHGRWIEWLETP